LGEFEQGRPVIERIRELMPEAVIVLTFFSPSGYEVRKNYPGADHIFYLPSDKPSNIRRFLDAVHPDVAIFVKYEFWLNYLGELRRRNVPTYLISAIFRPSQIHFQPWGGIWRRALDSYNAIFVQDDRSCELLRGVGYDRSIVAGDTRFDRVAAIARAARRIELIERFAMGEPLFVAGSTWGKDEELLIELINRHPDIRFLIAPHEMDEARMKHLEASVDGGVVRYTRSDESSDFSNAQLMILDTIGMLSSAYSYARWAYIGGGFGVGIHNTLEAATFGLPIAFGPNYHKFREACDMVELGAAHSVTSAKELEAWFEPLKSDGEPLQKASSSARSYTKEHCGATDTIMGVIFPTAG
jgi:3-deoxy-D-manno-octulosonic-acid transferase